jgi:hypothetical protein
MHSILSPVLALITWTLLIWLLMYVRRIPAMQKAGISPQDAQHPGALNALPARARAAADNYNHLLEQPTIFYALCFYTHLAGNVGTVMIWLAWGYVGLRVLHSLVQTTVNTVVIRFTLFCLSSLCLVGMVVMNIIAAS